MCVSYGYSFKDENVVYIRFGVPVAGRPSSFDAAKLTTDATYPGKYNPVVIEQETRKLAFMKWGLMFLIMVIGLILEKSEPACLDSFYSCMAPLCWATSSSSLSSLR